MSRFSNKGFTIIEIIFAMLIFGVIVIGTGRLLIDLQGFLQSAQRSSNRVLSLYMLTDHITDKDAFTQSLQLSPENDKLRVCVEGGSLNACSTNCCTVGIAEEFILIDRTDTNADLPTKRRLLGTTDKPGFYNAEGMPCNNALEKCYYKVIGSFTPYCPAGGLTCEKAEFLLLNLLIQPASRDNPIQERSLSLYFAPESNSKPTIQSLPNQVLALHEKVKIPVYANSGHPQEKQNFIFTQCKSLSPSMAAVYCYGFIDDIGHLIIEGLAAGTTSIQIQIDDTGGANSTSDIATFQIEVKP